MAKMRLDKFLSEMGVGSRSQIKEIIRRGEISVNGLIAKKPEEKVDPVCDKISQKGEEILYTPFVYYMLHKPQGVISAVSDARERTVLDLLTSPHRKDLFPVGRLDKDTEGLLLITNDGALANQLLAPKKHVEKVYYAKIRGKVDEEDQEKFARGLDIGEEKETLPAKLHILSSGEESQVKIGIVEGKFHQIKRMFHAVDKEVVYLKRLSMGTLTLDPDLKPGEYRELTKEEVSLLKSTSHISS